RTSGSPAYTSYSPAPGVFIVDLTATAKAADLVMPAAWPAGVTSAAAEEVVEMGNRLTRVTFHFDGSSMPEVAASEEGVSVLFTVPNAVAETVAVDPLPQSAAPAVTSDDVPAAGPPARSEAKKLPRARTLRKVVASATDDSVDVRLSGDGVIDYKAFALDNPPRVVIDLEGIRNAVAKNTVTVEGGPVRRVRVGQFKGDPDPVTRVVLDLDRKLDYRVVPEGEAILVSFGAGPAAATEPMAIASAAPAARVVETKAEKAPEPSAGRPVTQGPAKAAEIVEAVPVMAEPASTWKMPEPQAKEARGVIHSAVDQAPPATTARPAENVFSEPEQPRQQVLTGQLATGRTLTPGQRVFTGEPISLNLKDADIKDVLRTFAQLTGLNIAVDPGVSGAVTVDFVDVPWDQALDLILRQNGLAYVLEGNVMRVGTIERLAAETQAQRRLSEEERLNVPLQAVSFKLSYARAQDVATLLRDLASPRAKIIVDNRTNQLIVSEIPQYLQTMRNLIDNIDVPTRQVVIEARIVEASKVFNQQFGFNWGFDGLFDPALGTGTGLVFPNRIEIGGGPFNFGPGNPVLDLSLTDVLGAFTLDVALNAFEFEGLVKVISAPKVTTQDNQAAEIQSGFQIPYQTRVNFTTTVQYVDATLRLSVTPQITEAGTVIMEIAVQKNEPTTGIAIEGAAGTPLSTRQARTRLMVRDGGTVVIGGIYQVTDNRSQSRLPFLHQIPVLGNLFKTHNVSSRHDELLIFITPRIVRGA
ncbi:MAG TPA: type IV pilus secretin PilQ, partial [Thermoanaerobaculia bacterium]|nr:type IV pilus secretin PilQ [Thermoanaerobaculia bacterium]